MGNNSNEILDFNTYQAIQKQDSINLIEKFLKQLEDTENEKRKIIQLVNDPYFRRDFETISGYTNLFRPSSLRCTPAYIEEIKSIVSSLYPDIIINEIQEKVILTISQLLGDKLESDTDKLLAIPITSLLEGNKKFYGYTGNHTAYNFTIGDLIDLSIDEIAFVLRFPNTDITKGVPTIEEYCVEQAIKNKQKRLTHLEEKLSNYHKRGYNYSYIKNIENDIDCTQNTDYYQKVLKSYTKEMQYYVTLGNELIKKFEMLGLRTTDTSETK